MKKLFNLNLLIIISAMFISVSCGQAPSKDLLKKEVEYYFYQNEKNIYIDYSGFGIEFKRSRGDKFDITDVNITDISYKGDDGQIKILLSGTFILSNQYIKQNKVSFSNFPDQLDIKKYDSGWKVSSKAYSKLNFDFNNNNHRIFR